MTREVRSFKYRIKDRSARKALRQYAYAANQVWNWCVAQHRDAQSRYRAGASRRKWPTHFDLVKACAGVGADLGIHQQSVQAVSAQFVLSRNQHKRCPAFRSSFGQKRALGWLPFQFQSRRIGGDRITYRGKTYRFWTGGRPVPETAKGGAFIEDARGRWYVVFQAEVEAPKTAAESAVGIDLGLKSFATTSDGEVIDAQQTYRGHAAALATAQRAGNKSRVAAIHAKIANTRLDFHHKLSTRLAREYAFIAVGNVNAKRLAKTRMAKSVLDAGWSSFREMLRYKAATFVEVDEKFTTQTCSSCGALPPGRPKGIAGLGIRSWDCSACGVSHDRDVNAALNILAIGRGAAPRADESRRAA